jgi:16S rRNA (cytidine1402-2'-O)-methyltransferase
MSEAGIPCIADPGAEVVALAHQKNIRVKPLTGPSSIILALMASGFNGQNFVFHGYLPINATERNKKIKEMERISIEQNQTQIFIETPYRNNTLLEAILKNCKPNTLLCIGSEITNPGKENIKSAEVGDWAKRKINLHKIPAVFIIYGGNNRL